MQTVALFSFLTVPDGVKVMFSLGGKMTISAAYHLIWVFTVELFSTNNRARVLSQAIILTKGTTIVVPYINDLIVSVSPQHNF